MESRTRGNYWDGKSYGKGAGLAHRSVEHVTCRQCVAMPGELCSGTLGKMFDTHTVRRDDYADIRRKNRHDARIGRIPKEKRECQTTEHAPDIRNAIITGVTIRKVDSGCLTVFISLDFGGAGQAFGGHPLYLGPQEMHHKIESLAGHFIWRVLEIAGVESFDKIKGQAVRVKSDLSGVAAIGHIINDDWFSPFEEFKGVVDATIP